MKHKIISVIIGAVAFYATSIPATPVAIWIKALVFILVSVFVYVIIKPKKKTE